ncbi:flagellar basal body-associated protein FliL [Desulfococcus sp.]|uniref:flagellar basal body-associated FliL family protein n=1 Tax=Desulfococcus sp. TaxID=2025834 RepID=UPI0035939973
MNKKLVIIIGVVLVFLLGAGGAGFYVIWTKISNLAAPAQATETAGAQKTEAEKGPQVGPVLDLSTFIVNLADEDAQRFLKTSIAVEMDSDLAVTEATSRLPQIKDYIVTLLPTKKSAEILSTEGKQVLRSQLTEGLNRFLSKGKITSLYFTDFVIQ